MITMGLLTEQTGFGSVRCISTLLIDPFLLAMTERKKRKVKDTFCWELDNSNDKVTEIGYTHIFSVPS